MTRLNVGCGRKVLPDWENLDIDPANPAVRQVDVRHLPYDSETVDEILAEDILEHMPRLEWKSTLTEWWRVLKPGGMLTLQFPEMTLLARALLDAQTPEQWDTAIRRIFGGQGDGPNFSLPMTHLHGLSIDQLRRHIETHLGGVYVSQSTHNLNGTLSMRKP